MPDIDYEGVAQLLYEAYRNAYNDLRSSWDKIGPWDQLFQRDKLPWIAAAKKAMEVAGAIVAI